MIEREVNFMTRRIIKDAFLYDVISHSNRAKQAEQPKGDLVPEQNSANASYTAHRIQ